MKLKLWRVLIHTGWAQTGFWQLSKAPDVYTFYFGFHKTERGHHHLYTIYLGSMYINFGVIT